MLKRNNLLIFFFSFLLFFILTISSEAATISFFPEIISIVAGKTFVINVLVNSKQSLNAVRGNIIFPLDKIEVSSISTSNSIIPLWVKTPAFSNSSGAIDFEGLIPNPGFLGDGGKIFSITFNTKGVGSGKISIIDGSILANDGLGTQLLTGVGGVSFVASQSPLGPTENEISNFEASQKTPLPPKVSSPTHFDRDKWYNNNDPEFEWSTNENIIGVRASYDNNPRGVPLGDYNTSGKKIVFKDVPDGFWYFHIQLKNDYGWGSVAHVVFKIDTKEPSDFSFRFLDGDKSNSATPKISFSGNDASSGIEKYSIQINNDDPFFIKNSDILNNEYFLPTQAPGSKNVLIKAYDKAENYASFSRRVEIIPIDGPIVKRFPSKIYEGDALFIEGACKDCSFVLASLRSEDGKITENKFNVNQDNKFAVIWPEKIEVGVYAISLKSINNKGAQSLPTDPIVISVERGVLAKFGGFIISYLSIFVFLAIIISGLGLFIWYLWRKIWRIKKRLTYGLKGIHHTLHKSLIIFEKDIREELSSLRDIKNKRGLTKEEGRILERLEKDLEMIEKIIDREIDKIKDLD